MTATATSHRTVTALAPGEGDDRSCTRRDCGYPAAYVARARQYGKPHSAYLCARHAAIYADNHRVPIRH